MWKIFSLPQWTQAQAKVGGAKIEYGANEVTVEFDWIQTSIDPVNLSLTYFAQ